MNKWLRIGDKEYLIRGNWTEKDLHRLFGSYLAKYYPQSKATSQSFMLPKFEDWLKQTGKVYISKRMFGKRS